MNILTIAYYTTDAYEKEVRKLNESLRFQGLADSSYVKSVDPFKSWHDAVVYKPRFILETMEKYRNYDGFLYVDADARFMRKPEWKIFDGKEIGFMHFKRSVHVPVEFLTGTMFFANTPPVEIFVNEWADITPRYRHCDCPEQMSLKEVVERHPDLAYLDLPPEWVYIFDTFQQKFPSVHPIVKHYQASRRLKRRGKMK